MIPLSYYITLSLLLFVIGTIGVLTRRNLITILMSLELIFNAVNINLVAFAHYLDSIAGQIFVFFVITVAAAETVLGLAILIVIFRLKSVTNVDEVNLLRY